MINTNILGRFTLEAAICYVKNNGYSFELTYVGGETWVVTCGLDKYRGSLIEVFDQLVARNITTRKAFLDDLASGYIHVRTIKIPEVRFIGVDMASGHDWAAYQSATKDVNYTISPHIFDTAYDIEVKKRLNAGAPKIPYMKFNLLCAGWTP